MDLLRTPIREVEYKRRTSLGTILAGLAVMAAVLTLLMGNVKLYELRQESLQWEEQLEEQRKILAELEAEQGPELARRAGALGLKTPDPENVVILHIRGAE